MLCRWTFIAGRHVVVVVLSFNGISIVEGHVQSVGMSCRSVQKL